jgi:hypothetical protein
MRILLQLGPFQLDLSIGRRDDWSRIVEDDAVRRLGRAGI